MAGRGAGLVFNLAPWHLSLPPGLTTLRNSIERSKVRLPPPPGEGAHLLSKQHAGIQPGERWPGEAKSQAPRSLNVQGADCVPSRARNQIRPRDPERSRARGAHAALPRAPHSSRRREMGLREATGQPSRLLPGHGL